MNPNWARTMADGAKADRDRKDSTPPSDVSGGRHVRMREMFLKSEVGFEHPAKGPDHCSMCIHFKRPHACEIVAGYIRGEDWCEKFEERK